MNMKRWPHPVFVARDRGKSLPRLHKARVEASGLTLGFSLSYEKEDFRDVIDIERQEAGELIMTKCPRK